MLRMLCGLAQPSRGKVRVLGRDPRADVAVTGSIGLVPQQESVFEPLTAHGFVRLAAVLHGLPDPDAAAARALATVSLDPADTRKLPTYSKGMRQRVKVAQGLVHDPEVVMLDEPLTGLDPRQRADMIALFRRLGAEGRCVLVSSHVIKEAGTIFQGWSTCSIARSNPSDSRRMASCVKNQRCCGGVMRRHFAPASLASVEPKSPVVSTMIPPGLR